MPDPAKVRVAIIGCVLVIGASIGIGVGVSQKKSNPNGAIVENQNSAISENDGVVYKDPSPTKAKDILDELEHSSARYSTYTGNYIDYGSNPLEDKERSGSDDDEIAADWVDDGSWTDDGWDDDGWNDDGHSSKSSKSSGGYPVYHGSSKSSKHSGSKSNKGSSYSAGSSSKSNKGSSYSAGGSSKSNKGSSYSVGGSSKSNKSSYGYHVGSSSKSKSSHGYHVGSGKSNKGSSVMHFGGSSKSKGHNINVKVAGGKSNKGPSNVIHYVSNGKPVKDTWGSSWSSSWGNAWSGDAFTTPNPTPKPTPKPSPSYIRGKWGDDGHTPEPTPNPTPQPSNLPTKGPTKGPSASPSTSPTHSPSGSPSTSPTASPSNSPSRSPTGSPVASIVTPAPTICEERLWHPNPFFKFCINDSNYPANWATPDLYEQYFYGSLTECCQAIFGTQECEHVDICYPPTPTTSPVTPAPTTCEERKFYALNIDEKLVCSNGDDVPPGWAGAEYYYDNLKACCLSVFGNFASCEYIDVCTTPMPSDAPVTPSPSPKPTKNPTLKPSNAPIEPIVTPVPTESPVTPAPTPCEAQVFFFDGNVCTNEFFVADAATYATVKACCNMNFGVGSFMKGSCEYVDICNTEPPTPSPVTPEPTDAPVTPAPTPCEAQVFFFDGNVCTNEFFVADAAAYATVKACCNMNFGVGSFMKGSCEYVDICNTEPPTPSPVTPEPSVNIITPEPTDAPVTPAPTPCEAKIFFFDGETCSNEFYIADASSYVSAQACCNANFGLGSFMNGSCNYIDECNTIPPTPSPTFISTFGSTPTVSKETTGPPTMYAGRDNMIKTRGMPHVKTDTLTRTECEPIYAGTPRVCVYICTDIISVYSGEELISEDAKSYETECPEQ